MIRAGRGHREAATTFRSSKPEFPGGAKGLPRIPGARPSNIGRAASPLADVQRQYLEYGKDRSLAEEFTSTISNADAFRGIRKKLEASTQQAGEQAAEGGREGASFFDSVADSIRQRGAEGGASHSISCAGL